LRSTCRRSQRLFIPIALGFIPIALGFIPIALGFIPIALGFIPIALEHGACNRGNNLLAKDKNFD
jgi:predicted branched-subunit amino acid permease